MSKQQKAALAAFKRDTAEHAMTVLLDNGLYRHLRFCKGSSYTYGFDIITYPGRLVISGDMGDAVFARLPDMFEFFRARRSQEDGELYINPGYWHEKLTVGREENERVDEGQLKSLVYAYFSKFCREFKGRDEDDAEDALGYLREEIDGIFLCGYMTDLYREGLLGWSLRTTQARISAGRGTAIRQECIWINPACMAALSQQPLALNGGGFAA